MLTIEGLKNAKDSNVKRLGDMGRMGRKIE
jgi:hypothetical protein